MARTSRTHIVAQNIILDNRMYTRGESITFPAHVSIADIKEHLRLGFLTGDASEELDAERIKAQMDIGFRGMKPEEIKKIFRLFNGTIASDKLREREMEDARNKDDSDAARLANIAEAKQRPAFDDYDPARDGVPAEDDEDDEADTEEEGE